LELGQSCVSRWVNSASASTDSLSDRIQERRTVEESYGPDVLHLTVIKGYLAKLLANAAVVRWLARHQPEYLKEFQSIAELKELPWGSDESSSALKEHA